MSLLDTFGRVHDNLRISVTDRCNIRCLYCMPDGKIEWREKDEILSFEEIERFVTVAAGLGVTKLRLTGGEPLLRRHLPELIERLVRIPGIRDVGLTTNAVLLKAQAEDLYRSGLRRLNVHVDTLDRERFLAITRRDELVRVLEGIDRALEVGFQIKLNAVAMKGVTDEDIVPLARFGRERDIEVRYIEFMPLDAQGIWDSGKVLSQDEMLEMLRAAIGPLELAPGNDPHAPATEFAFRDGRGKIGFISSVTKPFCKNCNRIRLTAEGKLRYCLFAIEEFDVKAHLRSGAPDGEIAAVIRATLQAKWSGHQIDGTKFVAPPRPMYAIGG